MELFSPQILKVLTAPDAGLGAEEEELSFDEPTDPILRDVIRLTHDHQCYFHPELDKGQNTIENLSVANSTIENSTNKNVALENVTEGMSSPENVNVGNRTTGNGTIEIVEIKENSTTTGIGTVENSTNENSTIKNRAIEKCNGAGSNNALDSSHTRHVVSGGESGMSGGESKKAGF
ncbi:unnamed protein product [Allacma fusca]|uniref:Uncharacterized protein n=1 Tax=Allacma fusca TaxID=39272 RepID=A0A8J2KRR4_9HEXA|nr:unnamed protein product [Allacma fusca]